MVVSGEIFSGSFCERLKVPSLRGALLLDKQMTSVPRLVFVTRRSSIMSLQAIMLFPSSAHLKRI